MRPHSPPCLCLSLLHLTTSFQELLAHGVSNLISSFFSCFPNSATLATTSLLVDAGGNTQVRACPWVRRRGEGHPGLMRVEQVVDTRVAALEWRMGTRARSEEVELSGREIEKRRCIKLFVDPRP